MPSMSEVEDEGGRDSISLPASAESRDGNLMEPGRFDFRTGASIGGRWRRMPVN